MKIQEEAHILKVYISEQDMYHGRPLYEQIVLQARKIGIAGATVTKGILGYGADSRLHSAKILSLSENLPVIIEVVDSKENLKELMGFLDENVKEGLVTLEPVNIIKYRETRRKKT